MSIKTLKNLGFICAAVILAGIFVAYAQQARNRVSSDSKKMTEIEKEQKTQGEMFWKTSSIESPVDEGNKIVAIRRINFPFEDLDKNTKLIFTNKKTLVEIELYCSVPVPVSNIGRDYAFIGGKVFEAPLIGANRRHIFIRMELKEFDELKDGASVYFSSLPRKAVNEELIKESFKNGEPREITGAKFGRLDKKMIDQFSIVEEDNETMRVRVHKLDKPQR